ncbi:MAG TPA: L-histidine N(alpha)-methyltransferase [Rubricoccaceae bacterium]
MSGPPPATTALPPSALPDDPFAADVLDGLSRTPRSVPPKWLYDAEGSRLFEAITALDAYYPTRTERAILTAHAAEMAEAVGPGAVLIEYGSGSSDKTRVLLDALLAAPGGLAAYVPIDISPTALDAAARALRSEYPDLAVRPVVADYTRPFALPDVSPRERRVVFFPGSTVGNFTRAETDAFLRHVVGVVGPGGALLIGADQRKDAGTLQLAYDDPEGVTAAFNTNLLVRINRELDGDADLDAWAHEARVFEDRVEMHLVSLRAQTLRVCGRGFSFVPGESIHTETSTKYGPETLAGIAAEAGLVRERRWTDADGWFAVELYTAH